MNKFLKKIIYVSFVCLLFSTFSCATTKPVIKENEVAKNEAPPEKKSEPKVSKPQKAKPPKKITPPKKVVQPKKVPPKKVTPKKVVPKKVKTPKIEKKENPREVFAKNLNKVLNDGNYEKALKLFDDLKEPLSSDKKIKTLKLSVLISANKIDEASEFATMLEKQDPSNIDVLYAQAMLAQAQNDSIKKNKYLDKILAKNPKDSRVLTEQGFDLYGKKNYSEARGKFVKAYKYDNTNVEALIGLARVNYIQNKLDQAELNLNEVLKQQPKHSVAIAELARVKSETDRMYEALNHIKEATKIDPKRPSHWMDLGSYNLQIGRKKEALAAFNNVITLDPDSYVAYIYRAGLNDELGNKDEALNDYVKVCNLYPPYYFALEGAGILFFEKGEWQNARTAFVKALAKAPASYQYALLVTICDYKMDKKADAKKFIQNYLKTIDRNKNPNEYFLCRLFSDLAGDNEVLRRANEESDITKKGRMLFYIAEFYRLTKKDSLAAQFYADVLAISNPNFFEHRLAKLNQK